MDQCVIMVSAGAYRSAGQCQKKHGLRVVEFVDRKVPVCTVHRRVIEQGRTLARVTLGRAR